MDATIKRVVNLHNQKFEEYLHKEEVPSAAWGPKSDRET